MKYIQQQMDLSDVEIDETASKNRQKRAKWRKGMQSYCDKMSNTKEASITAWCVCGYMSFCDYCDAHKTGFSRACVNAIEDMCEKDRISIDYARTDYEKQLREIEEEERK